MLESTRKPQRNISFCLISPPDTTCQRARHHTARHRRTIRTPLNRRNLSLICLLPPPRVKNRPKLSSDNQNFFSLSLSLSPSFTHFLQLSVIRWLQHFPPSLQATWQSQCAARHYELFSIFLSRSVTVNTARQCAKQGEKWLNVKQLKHNYRQQHGSHVSDAEHQ